MKKVITALLLLSFITACGNQPEEQVEAEATTPQLVADVDAGKSFAAACNGCHGENGISIMPETPHIAGQPAEYLKTSLQAYLNGNREHELMKTAVTGLSEQDIVNLAGYYASLTAPDSSTNPEPAALPEQAKTEEPAVEKKVAAPAAAASCAGCHGATGISAIPGTPSLSALAKDYLVVATKAYKTQERQDPVMAGMVAVLSDEDIEAIAEYYAAQPLENATPVNGDAAAGEAAAAACAGCHGSDGNSANPAANPDLSAQDAAYLVKAMQAYKNNTRNNAVMPGMVAALGDADIENLAAFYASQKRRTPGAGATEEIAREPRTAEDWATRCDRCHGSDGVSDIPANPNLANQRADYLVKAISAYQNEERKSSTMHKMSSPLFDEEIQAIANYYSKR